MKTIIVAYNDIDNIDNHKRLFPAIDLAEDVKVVFHNDPQCSLNGDNVLRNYDVVISTVPMPGFENVVMLPRLSKLHQAMALCKPNGDACMEFYKLYTYPDANALNRDQFTYLINDVIFKPADGARGIAQLAITDVCNVNKATLFKKFTNAKANIGNVLKLEGLPVAEQNRLLDEYFKKEVHPNAKWSGIEQRDVGQFNGVISQPYFIQEFVKDILAEFRVIVSPYKTDIYRREIRKDRPFAQATGGYTSDKVFEFHTSEELNKRIIKFIRENVPLMNSADVFLFKHHSDDKFMFGIFEYCNQFGTDTDDGGPHLESHTTFIRDILETKGLIN